jgi:hypothetical protein
MTPTLVFAIVVSLASIAAVWPQIRGALRGGTTRADSPASGTSFVAFALSTTYGGWVDRPALLAAGAVGLVMVTLVLSVRAMFGAP